MIVNDVFLRIMNWIYGEWGDKNDELDKGRWE